MLEKTYDPSKIEGEIYRRWEEAGAFAAGRADRVEAGAKPYCIVIPPPNVTGSLHMGHALNNTLQDILVRFERMRGKDVLWQPGTDHAGIATQMVVERQLAEKQQPDRHAMGRAKFIERIWEWKAESGDTIINQLKRLGASCDWSRERFTMDEGLSKAVLKVFVELYRAGLIYKDKRLVNWDPKLLTAISDLEVQQVETKGHLWHFRYPIKGEEGRFITVATTRPETMLGDTAVAVHPEDERYTDLVGKTVVLPLVGREIPIVADEYADPEQGSGAVKITPAHDFNDFEVGRRHGLEMVNILDQHGRIRDWDTQLSGSSEDALHTQTFFVEDRTNAEVTALQAIPNGLRGLDRFEARKAVVEMLEAESFVEKIEDHAHTVPYGDRSNAVIEPYLTDQWYVDAQTLAKPAIEAVERGETVFVPKNWEKTYFEWMRNIQPWCISRQLWWGHQIPAWYGLDGEIFVAHDEEEAKSLAAEHYGEDKPLKRDPDVLDTWFSSALWPFSTLGWPDETPELKRYYKTDVLVTGFDIIFFWVARMMMMGLHFMREVPFHTVYIHALVRDEQGAKMSKSKGNVMDPLEMVDALGADALRFTLAAMAAQGRDIKLAKSRVEGYRNFGTKIWNAARFAEMNECKTVESFDPSSVESTINQWIITQLADTLGNIEMALDDYRFNDAANGIYQFVWNLYCDWYLELTKPIFVGFDEQAKIETRATVAYVRDQILKILHPFMPFITEELWKVTENRQSEPLLALASWPSQQPYFIDAHEEVSWLIDMVSTVRSVRTELNVPPGSLVQIEIINPSELTRERAKLWDSALNQLARISGSVFSEKVKPGSAQIIVGGEIVALPLQGLIDIAAETDRLKKEIEKVGSEIGKIEAKLANDKFVSRAPEHVVEEQRERKADAEATAGKLKDALKRLEMAV